MGCLIDLISATANVFIAIATWLLAFFAFKGLTAWKGNVHAAEELERKRIARKLLFALNRVAKEIVAIREGKATPSEFEAGINNFEIQGYKPQPAPYYVSVIDRLLHNIRCCREEALLFLPQQNLDDLERFCQTVSFFRDCFAQYRCSGVAVGVSLLTSRDEHALKVEKLRMTVCSQQDNDPFQQRLKTDLEAVVRQLNPYIESEVAKRN
jgi:hypothetical protein